MSACVPAVHVDPPRTPKLRFYPACRGQPSPARLAQIEVELRIITKDQRDLRRARIVERSTCSTRWGDDLWEGGCEYPPGLKQTSMVLCVSCRRFVPPQATEPVGRNDPRRRCDECACLNLPEIVDTDDGPRPGPAFTAPGSVSVVTIYQLPKADRDLVRRTGRSSPEAAWST